MDKPTRLDRNFIKNQSRLANVILEKGDLLLARRLIGLVAYAFQYPYLNETVFGEKYFDPGIISQVFSYNRKYLVSAHNSPIQFSDKSPEEINKLKEVDVQAGNLVPGAEPAWYTVLDNALYHLFYTEIPIVKNSVRVTPSSGTADVSQLLSFKVFNTLKKVYVNRTRKTFYEYTEDINFIRSTGSYYMYFDFELYRKLNLIESTVYLSMLEIRSRERYRVMQQTTKRTFADVQVTDMSIDYLAALWGLEKEDSGEKSSFTRTKNAITKVIRDINAKAGEEFCGLSWSFASPSSRFPGTPILNFPFTPRERDIIERDYQGRLKIFMIHLLKEQFRNFASKPFISIEDFNKQFINYLFHENIDVEGKQRAASEAYTLVSKRRLDPPEYARVPTFIKMFIDDVSIKVRPVFRQETASTSP